MAKPPEGKAWGEGVRGGFIPRHAGIKQVRATALSRFIHFCLPMKEAGSESQCSTTFAAQKRAGKGGEGEATGFPSAPVCSGV